MPERAEKHYLKKYLCTREVKNIRGELGAIEKVLSLHNRTTMCHLIYDNLLYGQTIISACNV